MMGENEKLRELCRDLWVMHMETVGIVPKQCEFCGAVYVPIRRDSRFCSTKCVVYSHRHRSCKTGPRPLEEQNRGSAMLRSFVGRMQELEIEVKR